MLLVSIIPLAFLTSMTRVWCTVLPSDLTWTFFFQHKFSLRCWDHHWGYMSVARWWSFQPSRSNLKIGWYFCISVSINSQPEAPSNPQERGAQPLAMSSEKPQHKVALIAVHSSVSIGLPFSCLSQGIRPRSITEATVLGESSHLSNVDFLQNLMSLWVVRVGRSSTGGAGVEIWCDNCWVHIKLSIQSICQPDKSKIQMPWHLLKGIALQLHLISLTSVPDSVAAN